MTDKVQKIREEVVGIINDTNPFSPDEDGKNSSYEAGKFDVAQKILQVIDSMQEEPVSIDFKQELYKAFGQVKDFTLGMQIAKWFYDMGRKHQEIVSGDLGKIAELYTLDDSMKPWRNLTKEAFIGGAQWQKKQEEPVSEELEEAAVSYAATGEILPNGKEMIDFQKELAFKAGALWQKEQLLAKAVETSFNVSLPSGLYDKLWIKDCKEGDKLLVIKKDEL